MNAPSPKKPTELLHLFQPGFSQGNSFTPLTPERSLWMLAYLAIHDRWVGRDELIRLLWPDADPETAKNNLRQLLHRTRKFGWAPTLEVERTQLRWREGSDLHLFRQAYQARNWQEVVETYQGELLSGFDALDAEEFSAWLEIERRDLNALWREAAQNLAEIFEQQGRFEEAGNLLERILRTDPLAEDVLCAYLRIASKSGRQDRALELYRDFAKQLDDELGLEPRTETLQLLEQLRKAETKQGVPTKTSAPVETPAISRLPLAATLLVGRRSELEWLEDKLNLPGAQVLCLVGPGGIGKTHLALEAARRFPGQAVFVSLVGHDAGRSLAPAVAQAMGLSLPGKAEPEAELLKLLQGRALKLLGGKSLLLVLDNVEQVIEEARLLASRLETLEGVQLLFTSRTRLGLASEHTLELGGLPFPRRGEAISATAESYDAVRLLLETVWRVNPEVKLSSADQTEAVHICQSVAGVPLALVLAGSWARMLSLGEIAAELEHNLDFLGGAVQGLPQRHQGMREVFEYSWKLLSEPQQHVLAALSVFRGGFDRTAAAAITGASNRVLLELLDSSLIRRIQGQSSRFDLHELLRQYAQEKLGADPAQALAAREKHAQWFLIWTEQADQNRPKGVEVARFLAQMEQEHDNLRAALGWMDLQGQTANLILFVRKLFYFWRVRGYLHQGREWASRALAQLGSLRGTLAHAHALNLLGTYANNLGDWVVGSKAFEECLEVARAINNIPMLIMALSGLGTAAWFRGDYPLARKWYQEALESALQGGIEEQAAVCLNNLAGVYELEGNFQAAFEMYQQALGLYPQSGDPRNRALTVLNQADVLRYLGDHEAAGRYSQQSLEILTAIGDTTNMVLANTGLGNSAFVRADYPAARSFFRKALSLGGNTVHTRNMALLFESMAGLLIATAGVRAATQLLGHADQLRENPRVPMSPNDLPIYQTNLEALKAIQSEADFSLAWQEGRGMTLEQALEVGLEALDAANI